MASLPAPVAAYSESGARDHAQCGPLSAQAAVHALGVDVPVPVHDNANAETLAAWINSLGRGLHASVASRWSAPSALAAAHIPQGHYLLVGVNCTSNAEPTTSQTGLRHWLPVYSTALDALNVWEPKYQRITDAEHNSLMNTVVVWRDGAAPSPPPAAPPHATVGDDMGASFCSADGSIQARFYPSGTGIEEVWYAAGGWHGPSAVPGVINFAGGLSASCNADASTQLVFWTGTDGHQWESWYAAGGWHGPSIIPKT